MNNAKRFQTVFALYERYCFFTTFRATLVHNLLLNTSHFASYICARLFCLFWDNMRLLSYNVCMRPIPFQNNTARLLEVAKEVNRGCYDIFLAQELFVSRYKRLTGFMDSIEPSFYFNTFHTVRAPLPSRKSFFCDSGLAIYTRYPVVETLFFPFSSGIYSDRLAEKGVLYARVVHDQVGPMHIFNTHVQSGNSSRSRAVRGRQFNELLSFITDQVSEDDAPIIVAGDFNMNTTGIRLPQFRRKSVTTILESHIPTRGATRIDDVFIQHDANCRVTARAEIHSLRCSDHNAISADISFSIA
jgi:endonuclease/exonuclease/phosphatase family metal-dependent hydrolase